MLNNADMVLVWQMAIKQQQQKKYIIKIDLQNWQSKRRASLWSHESQLLKLNLGEQMVEQTRVVVATFKI